MNTVLFVQQLLNGLLAGAYYLLIALGLSLIFSLGGIVNLAHGAFYALGNIATREWCAGESAGTLLIGFFLGLGFLGLIGIAVLGLWQPEVPGGPAGFVLRGLVWPTGPFLFWTFVQAAGSLLGVGFMVRAYQIAEASRVARVVEMPMLRRPAPLTDLHALRQLTRLIRRERYALVHTHAAKAGFLGRLAAHRAGVPAIIHTPHTFPFERVDTRLAGLYRWLERRAARWCHRIVCLTEGQRQLALDARLCPPEKLVVIPNGVELPAEPPDILRRRYRAELGIAEDTLVVGFVGRLTPQKDIQTFLRVAAELLRTFPPLPRGEGRGEGKPPVTSNHSDWRRIALVQSRGTLPRAPTKTGAWQER